MLQWIAILFLLQAAAPQNTLREGATISGIVLDSLHNEPLVNARVRLAETGRISTTDENGRFTFEGLAPGHYDLAATHPLADSLGLLLEARNVAIAGGEKVRVLLAVPGVVT